MERSKVSILFSLLSGVILFLYIAYSVIKTVDSAPPDNYFAVTRGVDFHDQILNAPTQSVRAQYEQADMSVPEYSPQNSSYIETNTESAYETSKSEYINNSENFSSASKSAVSTESSSGAALLAFNSGKHQDAESQNASETSSLTTDGSLSSTTTRQAANGTTSNGGRDPGGKNPNNSIPVGDGLIFLLFLSGIYSLFSLKNKNVRV